MYVGFLTRYRCAPQNCTWYGGRISGELAYSYDGLSWRRLGQPTVGNPDSPASASASASASATPNELQLTDTPSAVLFHNEPGTVSAGQVYATAMQPTRDGRQLLIYASVASVQHGHGVDSTHANASCMRGASGGGAGPCSHIATFRLRKDGFVGLRQVRYE
jgi:hypothetical protein